MIKGAKFAAIGIKKGGKYVRSKISKNEKETEISEGTMAKIKMAKVGTDAVFTFASTTVISNLKYLFL